MHFQLFVPEMDTLFAHPKMVNVHFFSFIESGFHIVQVGFILAVCWSLALNSGFFCFRVQVLGLLAVPHTWHKLSTPFLISSDCF